jgi:predicted alpha/beta-hydrolase family hydrolase
MSNLTNYTYSYNQISNSPILTIIVHGGGEGIESSFIQKIRTKYSKNSTLLIQMPFIDREEEGTSTPEFLEEIAEFEEIINNINLSKVTTINMIGKSIGGLVLLNYYYKNYQELKEYNTKLSLLGYLLDNTKLKQDKPIIMDIIQGSNDKYGSIVDVQKAIADYPNITLKVIENGDHSYRDSNKNPIYQDSAIEILD